MYMCMYIDIQYTYVNYVYSHKYEEKCAHK